MRLLLLAILAVAVQDDPLPELLRKLGSSDFEEQGRAAKAIEALGPKAAPALLEVAEKGAGEARAWAQKILARFQETENRLRALVAKLGSADDEEKETAETELRRVGSAALPYLREAAASDQKNLKRRAEKLLAELASVATSSENPLVRSRVTSRRALLAKGGGGDDTEDAVLAALQWLARHQSADGSWKTRDFRFQCKKDVGADPCTPAPGEEDFDLGNTALALLPFLGAGYSHLSKEKVGGLPFGDVVRKGLQWLLSRQDKEGCIGERGMKYLYVHALATLVLSEAVAFTGSEPFKGPAQKAVDFLVASQNPGKGWRYSAKCGDNDTSVTGWCVLAFRAAEGGELRFPKSAYDGANSWFKEATDPDRNLTGYTARGTGKVFIPGKNENFEHHEAMTAMSVHARIVMTKNRTAPGLAEGVACLLEDKPKWEANKLDYYYWHLSTQAIFDLYGSESPTWRAWNDALKATLLKNQNTAAAGCKNGSWEPIDRWSGEGGRVYATAINALTLETYYRNVRLFGEK